MGILSIRRGRSPNCSATGSVVGLALLSVTAAAVVVNAFADRFAEWSKRDPAEPEGGEPRIRDEAFGAVVAVNNPPALLYVNERTAIETKASGALVIGGDPAVPGALTAPTEVHLGVNDQCTAGCEGCYLDTRAGVGTSEPEAWMENLRQLAAMGVFEIALGGGESLHTDLPLKIARYARSLGMVPNITTSGLALTEARADELAAVMGQVNISLDGLGDTYAAVRGWKGESVALRGIQRLVAAGARVGVNTVIVQQNMEQLPTMARVLRELGVEEWQWLRFKPSGRGRAHYERMRLDPDQALRLWPIALQIFEQTGLTIRYDCAMIPFLAAHSPPLEALELLGVGGCPGGDSLWTVSASGDWLPCSFAEGLVDGGSGDLADRWRADEGLQSWRARADDPPEPCGSCTYRGVCRGGCRVVAAHLTGDSLAADPECPRVMAS